MSLYLQDGGTNAHTLWSEEAIAAGVASGAIISPFFTPFTPRRGHPTASQYADRVRDAGGEVYLDATTHAVSLPATSSWSHYNTWGLWPAAVGDLTTPSLRQAHVELVFVAQDSVGAPRLVPTVTLDNAVGGDADLAYELASAGAAITPGAAQSLVGRRGFWLSPDLDNYVGALQQLRAPVWFVTHVRESSDYPADVAEVAQTEAFLRTVDSLSRRSRVVVCHADLAGLPAVAAGAVNVGSGWHTKQRVSTTSTYQANDPTSVRRQATWFTYEGLMSRLHANESQVLVVQNRTRAESLYAGRVATGGRDIRLHHLGVVSNLVDTIGGAGGARNLRVATLRALYEQAALELDDLGARYGRAFVVQRVAHVDGLYEGLRAYGTSEGIWAP
jgi:hypothetical protein